MAAKAVIDTMTRNLVMELGKSGIRCYCVAPGAVQGTICVGKLTLSESRRQCRDHTCLCRGLGGGSIGCPLPVPQRVRHRPHHCGGAWFQTQPVLPRDLVERISRVRGKRLLGDGLRSTGAEQQTLKSTCSDKFFDLFRGSVVATASGTCSRVLMSRRKASSIRSALVQLTLRRMDELNCSLRS